MEELAAAPDPAQALRHLPDLFGQMRNPAATAEMLSASPRTARLWISLFGSSGFPSPGLLPAPDPIDQLVHRGAGPPVRGPGALRSALGTRLARLPAGDVARG